MNTFVTFKIEDAMKTFRYILFVWVMLGCGLFASCEDDEVEYAPLAVTRVSTYLTVSRALIRLILHSTS